MLDFWCAHVPLISKYITVHASYVSQVVGYYSWWLALLCINAVLEKDSCSGSWINFTSLPQNALQAPHPLNFLKNDSFIYIHIYKNKCVILAKYLVSYYKCVTILTMQFCECSGSWYLNKLYSPSTNFLQAPHFLNTGSHATVVIK